MASILIKEAGDILLVHEDIDSECTAPQEFNVINGHWTGVYWNDKYCFKYCDDSENFFTRVTKIYRNVEYNSTIDYHDAIRNFMKKV